MLKSLLLGAGQPLLENQYVSATPALWGEGQSMLETAFWIVWICAIVNVIINFYVKTDDFSRDQGNTNDLQEYVPTQGSTFAYFVLSLVLNTAEIFLYFTLMLNLWWWMTIVIGILYVLIKLIQCFNFDRVRVGNITFKNYRVAQYSAWFALYNIRCLDYQLTRSNLLQAQATHLQNFNTLYHE